MLPIAWAIFYTKDVSGARSAFVFRGMAFLRYVATIRIKPEPF
jgi:hypothetical protein